MNDDEGGDGLKSGEGKGCTQSNGEDRDVGSDQKAELNSMAESHTVESIISQVMSEQPAISTTQSLMSLMRCRFRS